MSKKITFEVIEGGPQQQATVQLSLPIAGEDGKERAVVSQIDRRSGWIDVEDQLPEEGKNVLVVTEDQVIGFGYLNEEEWEVVIAPWDCPHTQDPEVLYWM